MTKIQIEAVKKLISEYRSITVEKITFIRECESEYNQEMYPVAPSEILSGITGFDTTSCILCRVFDECKKCICYTGNSDKHPCTKHDTYQAIRNASSDENLIIAIRERADYLEQLISNLKGGCFI